MRGRSVEPKVSSSKNSSEEDRSPMIPFPEGEKINPKLRIIEKSLFDTNGKNKQQIPISSYIQSNTREVEDSIQNLQF
jgi:hypothetical protein